MAIDMPPFDDPKVRQAFRLIIDRKAVLEQVGNGYGQIANDLYSPFDEGYDKSLPQREQDIEQAKSLLKSAGKEGLSVDLHTTNGAAGMVELASVFASQAKAAGVNVTVKNDPNYYGDSYLKLPFSVDFWGTRGYLNQVQQGSLPNSPYNETHWPPKSGDGVELRVALQAGPGRDRLQQADRHPAPDAAVRVRPRRLHHPLLQRPDRRLRQRASRGCHPSKGTLNLAGFGHGYRTIWFS